MSDWSYGRERSRGWVVAVAAAVVVVVGVGAFFIGRGNAPTAGTPGTAPGSTTESPAPGAATAGTAPWTEPPGRGPTDTRDHGEGWTLPAPSAQSGPAKVSTDGVPFGYSHNSDGAMLAGVNATIAAEWMRYTSPDPWKAFGFLVASAENVDSQEWVKDKFAGLTGTHIVVAPGQKPPDEAAKSSIAAAAAEKGCECGLAMLGAKVVGGDASGERVSIAVQWADFRSDGKVAVAVSTVGLIWQDGDWKITGPGDNQSETLEMLGPVSDGFPLPAPAWLR